MPAIAIACSDPQTQKWLPCPSPIPRNPHGSSRWRSRLRSWPAAQPWNELSRSTGSSSA
ncbi:hypothetical protein G7085_00050 [Tessaracoccus sp. HDW20]|nr:hypothetical protein [Tessaracoccus coleopterorum]